MVAYHLLSLPILPANCVAHAQICFGNEAGSFGRAAIHFLRVSGSASSDEKLTVFVYGSPG